MTAETKAQGEFEERKAIAAFKGQVWLPELLSPGDIDQIYEDANLLVCNRQFARELRFALAETVCLYINGLAQPLITEEDLKKIRGLQQSLEDYQHSLSGLRAKNVPLPPLPTEWLASARIAFDLVLPLSEREVMIREATIGRHNGAPKKRARNQFFVRCAALYWLITGIEPEPIVNKSIATPGTLADLIRVTEQRVKARLTTVERLKPLNELSEINEAFGGYCDKSGEDGGIKRLRYALKEALAEEQTYLCGTVETSRRAASWKVETRTFAHRFLDPGAAYHPDIKP